MKFYIRIFAILFVIMILFTGCINKSNLKNFEDYKQSLSAVCEKASEYYQNNQPDKEPLTLLLDDYLTWADKSLDEPIEKVKELNLDYLWVSRDYVIFWNNEMKTYGILYSESARSVISQMKDWYKSIEHNKFEDNWYEIGQLTAR